MTEEIKARRTAHETTSAFEPGQRADTGAAPRNGGAESSRLRFNRYIYENLLCHIEGQVERWNRMAVRQSDPEAGQALWQKAEGLGYALRLLYAFKPEFEELVASAEKIRCKGCGAELEKPACKPASDTDLCDACYEIANYTERLTDENMRGAVSPSGAAAVPAERSAR